jgi:hypothetical protein
MKNWYKYGQILLHLSGNKQRNSQAHGKTKEINGFIVFANERLRVSKNIE